jgi:hypothetical protein
MVDFGWDGFRSILNDSRLRKFYGEIGIRVFNTSLGKVRVLLCVPRRLAVK